MIQIVILENLDIKYLAKSIRSNVIIAIFLEEIILNYNLKQ